MPSEPARLRRSPYAPTEALTKLPDDERGVIQVARDLIEICDHGKGQRLEYYRFLNMVTESGRTDGTKSLLSLCYTVLDRLASHLFSPTDIRFSMDFENPYDKETEARAARVARLVGHSWDVTDTDVLFAKGVFESLKYGLMTLKQTVHAVGPDRLPKYRSSLLYPWQIGFYRPDVADFEEQAAITETIPLTMPEVWRRIWHLPGARGLYDQIKASAAQGSGSEFQSNFNHPVLLSGQLQFSSPSRPVPGGIVGLSGGSQFEGPRAETGAPTVLFREVWVWDGADYTTIQMIQGPAGGGGDILIAPRLRNANLLTGAGADSGLHPYTAIQPNSVNGNIWGRSELADLHELQEWASQTAVDIRKLFGLQVDKLLSISGEGLTDELYGNMKLAGYMNIGQGGAVNDLTPAFPPAAIPLLDKIVQFMEMICGFDNLLSGKGEPGVRSGAQANPMMKTAGARLKDRSLEVERQCARAADLRLSLMEYKDGRHYWTDPKKPEETSFLLSDLPHDRRVVVDGHTTSPVFADDHQALIMKGVQMGLVDKVSAIEMLPFQKKDVLIARIREAEEKQAAMMKELQRTDPEGFAKAMEKALAGGKKR